MEQGPENLETETPCVPQVFLWEQQRMAGRLPRIGTGDSLLLPLAQGGHRPLSRTQSSPAAPASLPAPEPASQARVLPSSEAPARPLPFTTGETCIRAGQKEGGGAEGRGRDTQTLGTSARLVTCHAGRFSRPQSAFLVS